MGVARLVHVSCALASSTETNRSRLNMRLFLRPLFTHSRARSASNMVRLRFHDADVARKKAISAPNAAHGHADEHLSQETTPQDTSDSNCSAPRPSGSCSPLMPSMTFSPGFFQVQPPPWGSGFAATRGQRRRRGQESLEAQLDRWRGGWHRHISGKWPAPTSCSKNHWNRYRNGSVGPPWRLIGLSRRLIGLVRHISPPMPVFGKRNEREFVV